MNCQGIGRILGHKYEARYDRMPGAVSIEPYGMVFADDVVKIIAAGEAKTYRGDVCVRCGHVVNQEGKE